MKKLMIAFAAVAMAACAQAATVNWNVNMIQSSPSTTVTTGWLVQIYTSDVVYSYAAAKAGTISAWTTGATAYAGTTTNIRASGSGSQENGTSKSYYMVIYDAGTVDKAKNYIVSSYLFVTAPSGGGTTSASFGAMNGTATSNKFLNSKWESVPEPTSGLLLLLGVAGLALRRKQK